MKKAVALPTSSRVRKAALERELPCTTRVIPPGNTQARASFEACEDTARAIRRKRLFVDTLLCRFT